jgi:hypothetical protein
MKRIAWLLIAVFCTALVRVQPVDLAQGTQCACRCCHCKIPGDCGMPCNRAPTPAPLMFAAEKAARLAQPAVRRSLPPPRVSEEKFYAPYVEKVIPSIALNASALTAPAAGAPLFKAHCSFLI